MIRTFIKKWFVLPFILIANISVTASSEIELKKATAQKGRVLTFNEAAGRVAAARGLTVAEAFDALKRPPIRDRIAQLPSDVQTNIASYLEGEYELWKTLNTPADQVAFRDDGTNLVSVAVDDVVNGIAEVIVRNTTNGAINQRFNIITRDDLYRNYDYPFLSSDGTTIAASTGIWDTRTGKFKAIPGIGARVLGVNADGSTVALAPRSDWRNPIILVDTKANQFKPLPGTISDDMVLFIPDDTSTVITRKKESLAHQAEQNVINLWDTKTGEVKHTLRVPYKYGSEDLHALYKSGPGDLFANGLQTKQGEGLLRYFANSRIAIGQGGLLQLEFSQDGTLLVERQYTQYPVSRIVLTKLKNTTGDLRGQSMQGNYSSFALSPKNNMLALATGATIELWKESTALQDALKKKHAIEELRSKKAK